MNARVVTKQKAMALSEKSMPTQSWKSRKSDKGLEWYSRETYYESDPGAPVPYDQPRSNEQADESVGDLKDETMGFVERSRGEFLLRGVRVRRVITDPPEVDRQASYASQFVESYSR